MEQVANTKPFNKRAFVSIGMTISILILPVSGYMNHYFQFDPLSQARHFWMSVHNMAATLFVIFAVTHISMNWRALKNYLSQKERYMFSKESLAAAALIAGIVFLFASHAFHVG